MASQEAALENTVISAAADGDNVKLQINHNTKRVVLQNIL
jgi:hypothetical protein